MLLPSSNSSTAPVTITVTAVNDAPSFTKGADQTVLEDAGAQTVNPWATGLSAGPLDEAGQALNFVIDSNSTTGLFSSGPTVSSSGVLSYTPATNANGSATITLHIHDNGGTANFGVDSSATQTFTLPVTAVTLVPCTTLFRSQTVLEDAGAQTVNPWATGLSAGPLDEAGQALNFVIDSNSTTGLFSSGPTVSSSGVLSYTPATNANGSATITLHIHDNGGTANFGVDSSATQTFTLPVTAVTLVPCTTLFRSQTVLEDAGAQTVNPWATGLSAGPLDEAGQALNFVIDSNSNSGLFSAGPTVSSSGVLSYTPATNANGSATITLHIHDNGGTANFGVDSSATQTFTITVTAVNDAPTLTNDGGIGQSKQYSDPIAPVKFTASDIDNTGAQLSATTQFKIGTGAFVGGL